MTSILGWLTHALGLLAMLFVLALVVVSPLGFLLAGLLFPVLFPIFFPLIVVWAVGYSLYRAVVDRL